jgi:pimeloyl-ACP methyl ester carboxylesterase
MRPGSLGLAPDPKAGSNPSAGIQAVVDFSGPTDLLRLAQISPAAAVAVNGLLGSRAWWDTDLFRAASPTFVIDSSDPPILIIHGVNDGIVPPSQASLLTQALRAARVPHELILVRGAGHGLTLQSPGRDLSDRVATFLARFLSLTARRFGLPRG